MIRLIGIFLVWGGCMLWGVRGAQGVRQRVRLLEDMGQALDILERELILNRTALPELLERLSRRSTRQASVLFLCCKEKLEQGRCFTDAWSSALEKSGIEREERELLSGLAQVLGRYDAQGQSRALDQLKRELERRGVRHREEASGLSRMYCALGAAVGGFLTLTLI